MHRLLALTVLALGVVAVQAQDAKDSEKSAKTKKLLETKIAAVDYKDTLVQDVIRDLQDKVKEIAKGELLIARDPTGAVSGNAKVSYEAKNKTLKEVLDELCKKNDLNWTIVNGKYKAFGVKYDGYIFLNK